MNSKVRQWGFKIKACSLKFKNCRFNMHFWSKIVKIDPIMWIFLLGFGFVWTCNFLAPFSETEIFLSADRNFPHQKPQFFFFCNFPAICSGGPPTKIHPWRHIIRTIGSWLLSNFWRVWVMQNQAFCGTHTTAMSSIANNGINKNSWYLPLVYHPVKDCKLMVDKEGIFYFSFLTIP